MNSAAPIFRPYSSRLPIWYTANAAKYASPVWNAAAPNAHLQPPISRLIVANADMQGMYSSVNTRNE